MTSKATRQANRRRTTAAPSEPTPVPPEAVIQDIPAPEAPKETTPAIPGMKSETWSGVPMFRCERCGETTFNRDEAEDHVCKKVKFASEGDE